MDSSQQGDFEALRERRRRVRGLSETHLQALQRFHAGEEDLIGLSTQPIEVSAFVLHPVDGGSSGHLSISSAATCVRSLLASPDVGENPQFGSMLRALDKRYKDKSLKTRGLTHGNPYTLGQLLPTLRRMVPQNGGRPDLVPWSLEQLANAVQIDGIAIPPFPANGYLTYWSLVSLDEWGAYDETLALPSLDWSVHEMHRQLALLGARDEEGDAFQLGYNLLIQRRFRRHELKESLIRSALDALFKSQLPTGVWEKKEPLFRYGDEGDAYPFTFELLTAILHLFRADDRFIEPHEEHLERAVSWAERNSYGQPALWRSGHLASNSYPESWATAEVYYFLQLYAAYLGRRIFAVSEPIVSEARPSRPRVPEAFAALYQPQVRLRGRQPVLLGSLVEGMLESYRTRTPGEFSLANNPRRRELPRSGIFFGPPGTGKTTYAKTIADFLGWPLLIVNPSDFAAEGLLLIPNVGARLFRHLVELDDTVIFFDEMEELMRKRGDPASSSFEQRFLTTSFLPHLQNLRDRASTVYLVATNNIRDLDDAARAPRRFDFQLQVLPPSFDEKQRLLQKENGINPETPVGKELERSREKIEWATLREIRALGRSLARDPLQARELLESFEPALLSDRETLAAEAEHNRFAMDREVVT